MSSSAGFSRLLTIISYCAVGAAVIVVASMILDPVADEPAAPETPVGVRYLDSVAVMPLTIPARTPQRVVPRHHSASSRAGPNEAPSPVQA